MTTKAAIKQAVRNRLLTEFDPPFVAPGPGTPPGVGYAFAHGDILVDELYAGVDWAEVAISFWVPSGGLPVDPEVFDRYIANGSGNGWTNQNIYEWDGSQWAERAYERGLVVYVTADNNWYGAKTAGWTVWGVGSHSHYLYELLDVSISCAADGSFLRMGCGSSMWEDWQPDGVLVEMLNADYLDGKHASEFAALVHTHTGYSPVDHTHEGVYSPVGHLHTGLYEPAFTKNTAFNKHFGSTAGTVCQGNDSRLSDARVPLAHNHDHGTLTGLADDDHPQYGAIAQQETISQLWTFNAGLLSVNTIDPVDSVITQYPAGISQRFISNGTNWPYPYGTTLTVRDTSSIQFFAGRDFSRLWLRSSNLVEWFDWVTVWTSGEHPTTLAGYGITDAAGIAHTHDGTYAPAGHGVSVGYLARSTSATQFGNSTLRDNGSQVGIGVAADAGWLVKAQGRILVNGEQVGNAAVIALAHTAGQAEYTEIAHNGWHFSHGLLFGCYRTTSNGEGDLSFLGNTKHKFGTAGTGPGMIMYDAGWGGKMNFYVGPETTGADADIVWGTPAIAILRGNYVGINTASPSTDFNLKVQGRFQIAGNAYQIQTDAAGNRLQFMREGTSYIDAMAANGVLSCNAKTYNVWMIDNVEFMRLAAGGTLTLLGAYKSQRDLDAQVTFASYVKRSAAGAAQYTANWHAGGTGASYFLQFLDAAGNYYDNALFYDFTNKRWGIGNNAPTHTLHVSGAMKATSQTLESSSIANLYLYGTGSTIYSGSTIMFKNTETVNDRSIRIHYSKWEAGAATGRNVFLIRAHLAADYVNLLTYDENSTDIKLFESRSASGPAFGNLDLMNGHLKLSALSARGTAATVYLTTDGGVVKSRTTSELLSDVGAAAAGHDHTGVYEPVFSKNSAFNKNFGTVAGTVCQGDDARLSDARVPLAHNHNSAYYPLTHGVSAGFLARALSTTSLGNSVIRDDGNFIGIAGTPATIEHAYLQLRNSTANHIHFFNAGVDAPTFTTRSLGTKIVLYPAIAPTSVDYGIGVEVGGWVWNSVATTAVGGFKWYAGTTSIMQITGAGAFTLGSIPALGTPSSAFLVSDSGTLKTRSAAQILSDIGAAGSAHVHALNDLTDVSLTCPATGSFLRFACGTSMWEDWIPDYVLIEGLNAEMLGGNYASAFSLSGHNHSGVYSPVGHVHYTEGTFTCTLVDNTTEVGSVTATYAILQGKFVTLTIPLLTGTHAGGNNMYIKDLPAAIRPASVKYMSIMTVQNGLYQMGCLRANTTSWFDIKTSAAGTLPAGTCGLGECVVCYDLS